MSLERLKQQRQAARHLASESHVANDAYLAQFQTSAVPQGKRPEGAAFTSDCATSSKFPATITTGWTTGPVDQSGTVVYLSDRPSVCSAADHNAGHVVVGSTDHALYVVDVDKGTVARKLHGKSDGHAEWVTSVTYLPDGGILSGGMDSKLCLWPKGSGRAMDLKGHSAPISQVAVDPASGMAISASYDKTIRVWSVAGRQAREAGCLGGSASPVLELAPGEGRRLLSGDRSGNVTLWDLRAGEGSWVMKGVHRGHVTALAWVDPSGGHAQWSGAFASGGQDGYLRVWDPRARSNPVKLALHLNDKGHGAVTGIIAGGPTASYMCATCGADGSVRILDLRGSMSELASIPLTNYPYSFSAAGGLVLAGCGDGSLHVIDLVTLKTLYALGANQHAVRTIEASESRLICSGDDGNVVIYDFP